MSIHMLILTALMAYGERQETRRQMATAWIEALVVLVPAVLCCWLVSQGHDIAPLR